MKIPARKRAKIMSEIKKLGFHPFHHEGEGDIVKVSAEHGDGAADYYGEYRGHYSWINPKLEALAAKHDAFWEWENPGCIALYNI